MIDPTKPLEINEETAPVQQIDVTDDKLNERQELFCQYYATDREFFGNGVQTYIEIYEPDTRKPNWYKSACASASQILANIKVAKRINELLEGNGLNDNYVDKQLEFLVTQHADFKAKLGAIKEYNALKTRILQKIDHTTLGKELPVQTIILDTGQREDIK